MSKLGHAIREFRRRVQFNDEPKLRAIIAAVREEERAKQEALYLAAQQILAEAHHG